MAPHAAMGANLAMESAACFVNELRGLKSQLGKTPDQETDYLPPLQLTKRLESYTNQRRARVTKVATKAGLTEKINLKIDPPASKFIGALPQMKESDWLGGGLFSLCQAHKLEDWECGSDRVDLYSKRAGEAIAAEAEGRGEEYLESLLEYLGWV